LPQCKLVLELDGAQHHEPEQAALDAQRSAVLINAGFKIARFTVSDLYNDRDGVSETIWQALQ
jgi:very-short-patch-repair endonuclease